MDDYLSKPIDIKILAKTLEHWFNQLDIYVDEVQIEQAPTLTTPSETTTSLIDLNRLHDIFGENNKSGIQEFINSFILSTTDLLKELKVALQKKDTAVAKNHFHRLKGSAVNSGITAIYTLCKDSEEKVLNSDWKAAEDAFKEIEKMLAQLKNEKLK